MKKNKKVKKIKNGKIKNKGFTLLEITIVVTIIIILTSVVVANQRESEKQFNLQRSAHKLAQDLRSVENMAMTGQSAPETFGEIFPRGGYGLYFEENSNSYILFADCNNNSEYDEVGPSSSCASSTNMNAFPEKIEEFFLESGVIISGLSPSSPLNITFFPPDPTITIKTDMGSSSSATTTLLSLNGKTKTITINIAGLIDID